ncbi:glycosyl hydrolase [Sedimentisphaera cyanobacteriorum]|uniref:glycosyl hydrolase n=1 Tax=Sedimentisphaera cyanobacteriorum TaxID=1940790 RepID=UPI0013734786|nr:glycosyl hydrolase [Sedimentisphaera cyanobacteriorum]
MTNSSGEYTKKHYMLGVDWTCNWDIAKNPELPPSIDYTPQRWGRWWPGFANLDGMGATHILGHNEPDGENQADMTVQQSINDYINNIFPNAQQYDLLVGTPAATNYNNSWMQDFYSQAAAQGLTFDFTCIHWYKGPNADSLMNAINYSYSNYGHKKVWITEFNVADWSYPNNYSQEESCTFMCEALWRMGHSDKIERYAIFPWNGSSSASEASPIMVDGKLSPLGKIYANFTDADLEGPCPEVWYNFHNKAFHNRISVESNQVNTAGIYDDSASVDWKFVKTDVDDQFYIVSREENLKLQDRDGDIKLVPLNYYGDKVRWKIVDMDRGWKLLKNVNSGSNLRYTPDQGMHMSSYTGSYLHWFPLRSGEPIEEVSFEAENPSSKDSNTNFDFVSDSNASGGAYMAYNGSSKLAKEDLTSPDAELCFAFNIDTKADVVFKVDADMPAGESDSFFYRIDSGPWVSQYGRTTSGFEAFDIIKFPGLEIGDHKLFIAPKEPGAKIDRIILGTTQGRIWKGTKAQRTVVFEVEKGAVQSSFDVFEVYNDAQASNGSYIMKQGTGSYSPVPSQQTSAKFVFSFNLSNASDVSLEARVNFPGDSDDSFYYNIDGGPWLDQNNNNYHEWMNLKVHTFADLSAGTHELGFYPREDGAAIDRIMLTASEGEISSVMPGRGLGKNGFIGFSDYATFSSNWFDSGCAVFDWCSGCDFDMNGDVQFSDLSVFADLWLEPVPVHKLTFDAGFYDSGRNDADIFSFGQVSQHSEAKVCRSLYFYGNGIVKLNNSKGILGTTPRTCAMWIKPFGRDMQILSWGSKAQGEKWVVRVNDSGNLTIGAGGGYKYGTYNLVDGKWHHIAIVLPKLENPQVSDVVFYVDGQRDQESRISEVSINTSDGIDVTIGGYPESPFFYEGLIDELRIYDTALSEDLIQALAEDN